MDANMEENIANEARCFGFHFNDEYKGDGQHDFESLKKLWLNFDFRAKKKQLTPYFDTAVVDGHLEGPAVLQIVSLTNIAMPATDLSASGSSSRLLSLVLSDGFQTRVGLEHEHIPDLKADCPPGGKVLFLGAPVRNGKLLLTPRCIKFIGGEVTFLLEAFLANKIALKMRQFDKTHQSSKLSTSTAGPPRFELSLARKIPDNAALTKEPELQDSKGQNKSAYDQNQGKTNKWQSDGSNSARRGSHHTYTNAEDNRHTLSKNSQPDHPRSEETPISVRQYQKPRDQDQMCRGKGDATTVPSPSTAPNPTLPAPSSSSSLKPPLPPDVAKGREESSCIGNGRVSSDAHFHSSTLLSAADVTPAATKEADTSNNNSSRSNNRTTRTSRSDGVAVARRMIMHSLNIRESDVKNNSNIARSGAVQGLGSGLGLCGPPANSNVDGRGASWRATSQTQGQSTQGKGKEDAHGSVRRAIVEGRERVMSKDVDKHFADDGSNGGVERCKSTTASGMLSTRNHEKSPSYSSSSPLSEFDFPRMAGDHRKAVGAVSSSWNCSKCTFSNDVAMTYCELCENPR